MSKCKPDCEVCKRYPGGRSALIKSHLRGSAPAAVALVLISPYPNAAKAVLATWLVFWGLVTALVLAHMSIAPPEDE